MQTPQCPNCGRWSAGGAACKIVACLGCGTKQCFDNGSARGTCAVCHFGIMPGWSGSNGRCDRKGCTNASAFRDVPRYKRVCAEHAATVMVKLRFTLSATSLGNKPTKIRETLRSYVDHRVAHVPGYVRGIVS